MERTVIDFKEYATPNLTEKQAEKIYESYSDHGVLMHIQGVNPLTVQACLNRMAGKILPQRASNKWTDADIYLLKKCFYHAKPDLAAQFYQSVTDKSAGHDRTTRAILMKAKKLELM